MLSIDPPNPKLTRLTWTGFSLSDLLKVLRGHWLRIAAFMAAAAIIAIIGIAMTPRTYTATARVIYDPTQTISLGRESSWLQPSVETSMRIESQVEVMKSSAVAKRVIKELNLTEDQELQAQPSLLRAMLNWAKALIFGQSGKDALAKISDENNPAAPELQATLPNFLSRLRATRIGRSTVIEVQFWSVNPDKAVKIVNAVATAYRGFDMDQKAEILRSGSRWLQNRVDALREKSTAAQLEVEQFKRRGSGPISGAVVTLAGLESEARIYQRMYEIVQLQLMDTVEKVSYPIADARILSMASPSTLSSSPKTKLILLFAILLGGAISVLITIARLSYDGLIRTSEDLSLLGAPVLGRTFVARSHRLSRQSEQDNVRSDFWALESHKFVPSGHSRLFRPSHERVMAVGGLPNAAISSLACLNYSKYLETMSLKVLVVEARSEIPLLAKLAPNASPAENPVEVFREPDEVSNVQKISLSDKVDLAIVTGIASKHDTDAAVVGFFEWARNHYDIVLVDLGQLPEGGQLSAIGRNADRVIIAIQSDSMDQSTSARIMESVQQLVPGGATSLILHQGIVPSRLIADMDKPTGKAAFKMVTSDMDIAPAGE
ncbi:MAG: Wzz/FepE/Etk N-terminal domain-containing protein [Pseudomonadota bacterium]